MLKPTVIEIEASDRPLGKTAVNQLREESLIPSVIYGPKVKENLHVTVPELKLEKILAANTTCIASFDVEKKGKYDTLLKSVEFHPVTDKPLHADFYVLDKDVPVTLTIPIRLTGTAPGVVEGGILYQPLRELEARCDADKIPAELTIDISDLNIGDSLDVGQLDLEGVTPLQDTARAIVVVRPPKGAVEAGEAVEGEEEAEGTEEEAEAEAEASEESNE